jgi:hypothetical protein
VSAREGGHDKTVICIVYEFVSCISYLEPYL